MTFWSHTDCLWWSSLWNSGMLILSPKLWLPGKGDDHCTGSRAEMVAKSAASAWPHTALLPPGGRELLKGTPGPKPRLADFLSVPHCLPSWLHASCLTSRVGSPSCVFHFWSALSFGVPVLVFFPGYLFMSWFITYLILLRFGSFRLARYWLAMELTFPQNSCSLSLSLTQKYVHTIPGSYPGGMDTWSWSQSHHVWIPNSK